MSRREWLRRAREAGPYPGARVDMAASWPDETAEIVADMGAAVPDLMDPGSIKELGDRRS